MLDCCRPLSAVASVGITLSEFGCLARCNGLQADIYSPLLTHSDAEKAEAFDRFKRDLKEASRGTKMMALAYSRKSLGQTGDGHFSPVGGYAEKEGMVSRQPSSCLLDATC